MKNRLIKFLRLIIILGCVNEIFPMGILNAQNLEVNSLFSDHMVMQQNTNAKIWGKAEPECKLNISGSWGEEARTVSNVNGDWFTELKTPSAGGPYSVTVSTDEETIAIKDVMIGEVWICSGQSNMEMPLKGFSGDDIIAGSEMYINSADYYGIRMFTVNRNYSALPENEAEGEWQICSPQSAGDFSAAAFFFGRKLHEILGISIGLIHSSWGGTPAESWTSLNYLKQIEGFKQLPKQISEAIDENSPLNVWLSSLVKIDPKEFNDANICVTEEQYVKIGFDDTAWEQMQIPEILSGELENYDGVIWFRKEFYLDEKPGSSDYCLELGYIDDDDVTYLNGEKVGNTYGWKNLRSYPVSSNLLKKGKNVIAVRLADWQSNGGIYAGEEIGLKKNDKLFVDLKGMWKYLPSAMIINNTLYKLGEDESSYKNMPDVNIVINQNVGSSLYNGMINPLKPFSIKGAIWYQGESNVGRADQYDKLFPAMINSWRNAWGYEFPFYYVQIAPYIYSGVDDCESAELRFSQNKTLRLPKTGQVVTLDIGSIKTIHPSNKKDVGERLALWALAKDYGKNVNYSGPICKSAKYENNKVILYFDPMADTLEAGRDGLKEFEIVVDENAAYETNAVIDGNKVLLSVKDNRQPIAVRYAWKNGSTATLFNSAGLPASTFYIEVE